MQIRITPLAREDLMLAYGWRNNPDIMIRTRQSRPLWWDEHLRWYENLNVNRDMMFAIKSDELSPITFGVCGLTNIDWIARSAELSIYIGSSGARKKGYGKETVNVLLQLAFLDLGLYSVWVECFDLPTGSGTAPFFQRCGFELGGRRRAATYKQGRHYDSLYLTMLRPEWERNRKE